MSLSVFFFFFSVWLPLEWAFFIKSHVGAILGPSFAAPAGPEGVSLLFPILGEAGQTCGLLLPGEIYLQSAVGGALSCLQRSLEDNRQHSVLSHNTADSLEKAPRQPRQELGPLSADGIICGALAALETTCPDCEDLKGL